MSHYADQHHKLSAKNWSRPDWHVAWLLVRDVPLALLHDHPRRHAILSVLIRVRALEHERLFQADGWPERHSGLHSDVHETAEPLV